MGDGRLDLPSSLLQGPLLDGAPVVARAAFLRRMTLHEFPGDTTIFEEKSPGDRLFVVVSGMVSLTYGCPGGDVELDRTRAGDVFGELDVLAPAPRPYAARSVGPVVALELHRRALKKALEARDPAAEALLRYCTKRICRRLRRVNTRLALVHELRAGSGRAEIQSYLDTLDALRSYQ